MKKFLLFTVLLLVCCLAPVFGQSSGIFEITQAVVGSGGQHSANGNVAADGTIGQSMSGNALSGNAFSIESGFWNFAALAPTAANASIRGRILTAQGSGISSTVISLTNISGGQIRFTYSNGFGYFHFENIPVGETYILTVRSKRFVFLPETRVITLLDELTDVNFTAEPEN